MTNAGAEHIDSDILAHFISLGVDGAGSYALQKCWEASLAPEPDHEEMTDVTTMTFTEFLEARFAEDEAVARDSLALYGPGSSLYVARHDPARVLAECAAKRAILAHLADAERGVARAARLVEREGDSRDAQEAEFAADAKLDAVTCIAKHVAEIYAEHEDFDEAWRP